MGGIIKQKLHRRPIFWTVFGIGCTSKLTPLTRDNSYLPFLSLKSYFSVWQVKALPILGSRGVEGEAISNDTNQSMFFFSYNCSIKKIIISSLLGQYISENFPIDTAIINNSKRGDTIDQYNYRIRTFLKKSARFKSRIYKWTDTIGRHKNRTFRPLK